jgi:hypothetical protein
VKDGGVSTDGQGETGKHLTMDRVEASKWAGKFTVPPGKDIYGELTLSGAKTSLYLHDKDFFSTHAIPDQYIKGVLHDLTKISLIQCVTMSGPGHAARGGDEYHFASVFPHFVVYGDSHIAQDEKSIAKVHLAVDDATTIFYDFDAFGFLIDARPFIDKIADANALGRQITTGPDPDILYFTGKKEIFAAETVIGRVSASHNPRRTSLGGPNGVGLSNTIFVTIEFSEPILFEESILHTSTLLRYLGMLAGRPQNLIGLDLQVESGQQNPAILQVYWSMPPKREPSKERERPHASDVLLDAVGQPEEFSRVLANWLDREQSWRDARLRFSNSFAEQNDYSIDRLIGAANMFDILPSGAVPSDVPLSKELVAAKEEARKAFLDLPPSAERDSVRGLLGRIGKSNLKQKIRHRAEKIVDAVGEQFPELLNVTNEAVNCRNYYVHGSERRFDYSGNFDTVTFFIDTLEFVFAASDLIEAGWDVKAWSNAPTMMSHPFARFRVSYATRLQELKALLSP